MSLDSNYHLTVKPAGASCNMNCIYCYFLGKTESLGSRGKMDGATLENFIKNYITSQTAGTVFFTWHGGEPTLLGVDYFREAVRLQQKYCPPGKRVENDLQTNGLLIDDEWCKFLKENRFLVGLSVDGDEEGNIYRTDNTGKPALEGAIRASRFLRRHDVPFNTLTVVNNINSKKPLRTYRFLKDVIGSRHMQFIPLVEVAGHRDSAPEEWGEAPEADGFSVAPRDWGLFLLEIFDRWYNKDQGKVFVYLFENFLSLWLGKGAQMCYFEKVCSHAMALDRDGSVYACDHYAYPEYYYGNINETPLYEVVRSPKRSEFAGLKDDLPRQCLECLWLDKCNGECPKKRFVKTEDGPGLNYLCEGYRLFFEKISGRMAGLCEKYGGRDSRIK